MPTPDLTVKATGNQWYWTYDYPANDVTFDSLMLSEDDLAAYGYRAGGPPARRRQRAGGAGGQGGARAGGRRRRDPFLHRAGLRHQDRRGARAAERDLVPGPSEEGIYFGQCSELCGKNHSYMPITVKVVSQEAYDAWLDWAIDEYGGTRPEAAAPGAAAAAPAPAPPRRRRRRGAGGGGPLHRGPLRGSARCDGRARAPEAPRPSAAEARRDDPPRPRRPRRRGACRNRGPGGDLAPSAGRGRAGRTGGGAPAELRLR